MRILVAGIGNIFFGDDGFGVEVVRRLCGRKFPENVCVKDFGLRGFDLASALCESWDLVILVDAVSRGAEPGCVYVIEPEIAGATTASGSTSDPHGLNPMHAIELAKAMGNIKGRVLLVGCEPMQFESEGEMLALSAPVEAAVDTAIHTIERILGEFRHAEDCVESASGGLR